MARSNESESDEALTLPEANDAEGGEGEKPPKLDLKVDIQTRSACERHITVTIDRKDIDRYFEKEFSELVKTAQVPGFRPGHTPRKLVEKQFRKDVTERVKSSLLMDSIAQVSDDEELSAISEPEFHLDAVTVPDEGSMTYEFDLEVRPEFDVPQWKGLSIDRPVHEFADKDVDEALSNLLSRHGQLTPRQGAAEAGDYITTNLTFSHDGKTISTAPEEVIRIRPVLSFRDGKIEKFDELMVGVKAGETRSGEAVLSQDAPNEQLRGQKVTATFEVKDVKRLELPEITPEFLEQIGGFESEAELRDGIRDTLKRRLEYRQHQAAREQITNALTVSAGWELPPELLKRQSERELSRAVLELRRAGFSDDEIRGRENMLRQNSQRSTAQALKEHFILEKIAEQEKIEDEPADYDTEIQLLAAQSGETSRRVRARLEKTGRMDVLRNQIIERKVIELILAQATFKDVPYRPETVQEEAVDRAAGGGEPESDIPEAKPETKEGGAES